MLRFTKNEIEPLESKATQYNKALSGQSGAPWYGYAAPDLYSGLLTSEVVQHICLNRDLLSVTIPYIPDNLKDCMVMETIQSLHTGGNENPVGSNVKVHIMVKDPRGEKPHVLVEPVDKNLQACTEMNNTSLPNAKFCEGERPNSNSNREQETTTLNLSIALGTSIPLILLCCASGIILFLKKRSRRGEEAFEDQDDNPVYGIYASNGMDTSEATDNNELYGGGGEEDEEEVCTMHWAVHAWGRRLSVTTIASRAGWIN